MTRIPASSDVPAHGLLSGMILTTGAALAALVAGLAVPGTERVFGAAPSRELLDCFLLTLAVMAAHKLESYLTGEFDVCPVYLNLGRKWAQDVRRAAFTIFVTSFLAAMLLLALVMRGAPWPLLLLGIWAVQGLHELHHLAKSLARRRYYPGVASALAFTASIDILFVPRWIAQLQVPATPVLAIFLAVQPPLMLAFYLEDRRWLAAAGAARYGR